MVTWPFSFNEFIRLRGIKEIGKGVHIPAKRAVITKLLNEYIKQGGFPEVIKQNNSLLLEQYFKDILYRDLIARYSIRNIREIKDLCLYLFSNIGAIASYKSLMKSIQAGNLNTVKNYIEMLEQVYLFHKISLFDYSIKRQMYNPSKFYSSDTGMSNALGFSFSKNIGRLYENVVCLELKRRGHEVYYWKSLHDSEVDFIVRKGLGIQEAIQVCFDLSKSETRQREYNSLIQAHQELKPRRLIVLTEYEEKEEVINRTKIQMLPLWKWLLNLD